MNSFSRSVDLLQREMDVTSLRYQVSANNLANAEVPNFKRSVVNFESELKRAFESEAAAKNSFQLTTTDSRHMQINTPIDYRTVEPRRVTDYLSTSKANGNNVDAETEANNILQIQMQYRLLTQLATFEFDQVNTAMKK
ncbi:MAG: flagellar basal body rod protein FlgB [Treponema sp.]|jgi:flagellar basal-body rod protein FlgB|nr:flagellar basal body rod protein FlgB [Treponema sp.]